MSQSRKRERFNKLSRSTKWRRTRDKKNTWEEDDEIHDSNEYDVSTNVDELCSSSEKVNEGLLNQTGKSVVSDAVGSVNIDNDDGDSSDESSIYNEEPPNFNQNVIWGSTDDCTDSDVSEDDVFKSCDEVNLNLFKNFENGSSDEMSIFLRQWALECNVNLNAMDKLLQGLKTHACFSTLPSCGRTLLQTPTHLLKSTVEPGEYIHIGVEKQLVKLVSSLSEHICALKILVNIDGLPIFKSSPGELYPILITALNIPELKGAVVPVGIYFGKEKPHDVASFLMPFVEEISGIVENGLTVNKNLPKIAVSVEGFCCDAPAKSFIMGIVAHNGFYSCTRCKIKGETVEKTRVFTEYDCPKRLHCEFLQKSDDRYQRRNTPVVLIPGINFPSSFILDYMHLVCLGVTRTLLFVWNNGIKSAKSSRLSRNSRHLVSVSLNDLTSHMPSEFVRKPRELNIVMRWKATELRSFLLYTGPIVLKNVLGKNEYMNFLQLHTAITILLNPNLCKQEILREHARKLLIHFVESVAVIYGRQFITHNFHGLTHIVDDADHFLNIIDDFSLDNISAFCFENYLQKVKGLIRDRSKPLEQIGRRLAERFLMVSTSKGKPNEISFPKKSSHMNGPLLALCTDPQYNIVIFPNFKISTKVCDRYCGTDEGDIIEVHNICWSQEKNSMVIIGKRFTDKNYFYSEPINSTDIGVFRIKNKSTLKSWKISKITKKYVCLPYKRGFVAFTLLHTSV